MWSVYSSTLMCAFMWLWTTWLVQLWWKLSRLQLAMWLKYYLKMFMKQGCPCHRQSIFKAKISMSQSLWPYRTPRGDVILEGLKFNFLFALGRGGSRTSIAGGAQVTNEAEGFTEARSAERGRVGEGVTPSRRWGSGGPPPEIFWDIASKWCILSAFCGNQYTFFCTENLYEKNASHFYI